MISGGMHSYGGQIRVLLSSGADWSCSGYLWPPLRKFLCLCCRVDTTSTSLKAVGKDSAHPLGVYFFSLGSNQSKSSCYIHKYPTSMYS